MEVVEASMEVENASMEAHGSNRGFNGSLYGSTIETVEDSTPVGVYTYIEPSATFYGRTPWKLPWLLWNFPQLPRALSRKLVVSTTCMEAAWMEASTTSIEASVYFHEKNNRPPISTRARHLFCSIFICLPMLH